MKGIYDYKVAQQKIWETICQSEGGKPILEKNHINNSTPVNPEESKEIPQNYLIHAGQN